MDKCEWKDGKFEGCGGFDKNLLFQIGDTTLAVTLGNKYIIFCPFCGADIRKPEEKPLIVKSGGTWVAHFEGVDYLYIGSPFPDYHPEFSAEHGRTAYPYWKPFSEIEKEGLTDEVAGTLRPMIKYVDYTCQLIHIQDEGLIHIYDKKEDRYHTVNNCRLATPDELLEAYND